MDRRFIALSWPRNAPRLAAEAKRIGDHLLADPQWRDVSIADTLRLYYRNDGGAPRAFENGRLRIIGRIGRGGVGDASLPHGAEPAKFEASLAAHCGGFVILRHFGARTYVYRDPTGAVPLYRTRRGEIEILFAHGADARTASAAPFSIDWTEMGLRMRVEGLARRRSPLTDVEEILPGEAIVLGAAGASHFYWDPRRLYRHRPREGIDAHAARLQAAVDEAAASQHKPEAPGAIALSGGLDSSIVASAMSCAGAKYVNAFNLVAPGPGGDESAVARAMAERAGLSLSELRLDPDAVDLFASASGIASVKPFKHVRWCALGSIEARAAGSARLFKGAGGDNVFFFSARHFPLIDLVTERPLDIGLAGQLMASARRQTMTVWQVVSGARKAMGEHPFDRSLELARSFLSAEFSAALQQDMLSHPWYAADSGLPPGKRAHLAMILGGLHFYESYYPPEARAPCFPLLSQPVIEACVQTPIYLLAGGVRDRALARHAFAKRLPRAVLDRVIKGRFTGYFRKIFMANCAALRERLLDGVLVHERVLDRAAVEAYFAQGPPMDADFFQLMECLDVELWAAAWAR